MERITGTKELAVNKAGYAKIYQETFIIAL
jgi:hypothetical protein